MAGSLLERHADGGRCTAPGGRYLAGGRRAARRAHRLQVRRPHGPTWDPVTVRWSCPRARPRRQLTSTGEGGGGRRRGRAHASLYGMTAAAAAEGPSQDRCPARHRRRQADPRRRQDAAAQRPRRVDGGARVHPYGRAVRHLVRHAVEALPHRRGDRPDGAPPMLPHSIGVLFLSITGRCLPRCHGAEAPAAADQ